MTLGSRSLFLALGVSLGATQPAFAQNLAVPTAEVRLIRTSAAAGELGALMGGERLAFASVDRLYAAAFVGEGLEALRRRLAALAAEADPDTGARALLVRSVVEWRDGDLSAAMSAADAALERSESVDGFLLKGRLLDIQGEGAAALQWYERALAASTDAGERAFLQRRIAIIGTLGAEPGRLATWASADPAAHAGRAAIVLALLGRFDDAVTLQRSVAGDYPSLVRLADWAIASSNQTVALEASWRAYQAAQTADDRRYALALVVEAFRDGGALDAAEAFLAARRGPDINQARLDVLLELGRYDDAVALAGSAGDTGRLRLLEILQASRRTAEVEQEYRRLLREQPNDPRWPEQLAGFYLQQDRKADAAAVYETVFRTHRSQPALLIQSARRMMAMGLQDDALRLLRDSALTAAIQQFEVEAAIEQGRTAEAEGLLAARRRAQGGDAAALVEVAEGYERLGLEDMALEALRAAEAIEGGLNDDQVSHLADLALETGDARGALDRWLRLWDATQAPARKSYLQRRIILAAQRLNQLEAVATDLERRLIGGAPRPGDIELLVEIRILQANGAAAVQAVQAYAAAGGGERERLEQLASVYARLRMHTELNATLEQLAQSDPSNADAYLRRLIVNVLRWPTPGESEEARDARIDALLDRLQAAGGLDDAEAARFAASIYASGHRQSEALTQFQRALALAPADIDAQQQLAGALKAQGQVQQALALLQYRAEIATDDAAFVTAVNSMLDVIAPGDADGRAAAPPPEIARARLGWARQALLERALGAGEPGPLTTLLSDVAHDQQDPELQARALRLAIADAGDQKPAVLRHLVTVTASATATARDQARQPSDAAANAAYGRRLVALRHPYPPEVYRDIARSLLAAGDRAGAGRAFALMEDMDGLVNTDALRAEAYAASGYLPEARENYRLALLRDQDDLEVMAGAAILMEQMGDRAEADALYWRAVNQLIQRQPARLGDEGASLDIATLAPTLIEGLLLNWPATDDTERRAQWRRTVEAVIAEPAGPGGARTTLAARPRLALTVALNRRIAAALGDEALASLEAPLVSRLRADESYQRDLAAFRGAAGFDSEAAPGGGDEMLALTRQAAAADNDGLLTALAFARTDRQAIQRLFAQAIGAEASYRAAREQGGGYQEPPTGVLTLMMKAADAAPDAVLRDDLLTILEQTPFAEDILFDLLRADPSRYDRFEAAAGRALLSDQAIVQLLIARANAAIAGPSRPAQLGPWLSRRLGRDRLLSLYAALTARAEQSRSVSLYQSQLLGQLLAEPLSESEREALAALIERDLASRGGYLDDLVPVLLKPQAPVANRSLMRAAARRGAEAMPALARLPEALEAVWSANANGTGPLLAALGRELEAAGVSREAVDALLPPDASRSRVSVIDQARLENLTAETLLRPLLEADGDAAATLRRLWRGSAPRGSDAADHAAREALVSALASPTVMDGALERILLFDPAVTDEIDAYLAAAPPAVRQQQQGLYARVAAGWAAQGRGRDRWAMLNRKARMGRFDDHDVGLWLALQSALSVPLEAGQLRMLAERIDAAPVMSADRRVRLGQVFGRFGDPARGVAFLEAALLQALYPASGNADTALTLPDLTASLEGWPQRAAEAARARLQRVMDQQATAPAWSDVRAAELAGPVSRGRAVSFGGASRLSSGP